MEEMLLLNLFRNFMRLYRMGEAEPSVLPWVIGFVVVLWALVFWVNWFTNHRNRK